MTREQFEAALFALGSRATTMGELDAFFQAMGHFLGCAEYRRDLAGPIKARDGWHVRAYDPPAF